MKQPRHDVRFDQFAVCFRSRELFRGEIRLPLQHKPFQVLQVLLEESGEVVTRERLKRELWGGLAVDGEAGLNTAVKKLREALGDKASKPKYIETVPRLGYRFLGAPHSTRIRSWRKGFVWVVVLGLTMAMTPVTKTFDGLEKPGYQPDRNEAMQWVQMARYRMASSETQGLEEAAAYFRKALGFSSTLDSAWSGLANCLWKKARKEGSRQLAHQAAQAAQRGLAINERNGQAWLVYADYKLFYEWDLAEAGTAFGKALAADSDGAETLNRVANFYALTGRSQKAVGLKRRAVDLDPSAFAIHAELGYHLLAAKQWGEAISACRMALLLEPDYRPAKEVLILALLKTGDDQDAKSLARELLVALTGDPETLSAFDRGEVKKSLALWRQVRLSKLSQHPKVPLTRLAAACLENGEPERALVFLYRAFGNREPQLLYAFSDPIFQELQQTPSYQDLKCRVLGKAVLNPET